MDDFETIYRQHYAAVWRFVLHLGIRNDDVPDVTHNVFLIAYRKLATFEGRSSIRTWLCGIAFRVVRDLRKSAAHRLEVPTSGPALAEASDAVRSAVQTRRHGDLELAQRLLDALPEEQREVFVLHELEQMTGREIAEVMGTPVGTVRSRLRRARASFQKHLAALGETGVGSVVVLSEVPWLAHTSSALETERSLLQQLTAQQPPAGAVEQGWSALAAQLAHAPAATATVATQLTSQGLTQAAAQSGASLGTAAKLLAGASLAVALAWAGTAMLTAREIPVREPTERAAADVASAEATAAPPPASHEANVVEPKVAERAAAPSKASGRTRATSLPHERRMLAQAHALVQAGRGREALRVLRRSRARYPRSVLSQEREVLTAEALANTGAVAAARRQAMRFMKRHPNSPHASRLQRFLQ